MKYKFYDTCSLLKNVEHMFQEPDTTIVISSITLEEIENIKTASNRDAEVKYSARKALHMLEDYYGNYEIVVFEPNFQETIDLNHMPLTNDSKIIACAIHFKNSHPDDDITFVTNDLSCKHLAHLHFGNKVEKVDEEKYDYDGYKEVYLDDIEMGNFYSNLDKNLYNLYINEYLLIYNKETGECVDRLCWTGETYRHLNFDVFSSHYFGDVKPMKGDYYQ